MGNNHNFQSKRLSFITERNNVIKNYKISLLQKKQQLKITESLENNIFRCSAYQLCQMLNNNEVNSEQLVTVYAYRASTLGMELNLITEQNFNEAFIMAKKCDAYRKESKKKNWTFKDQQFTQQKYLPPLYGVPISIKDAFDQKDKRTTLGLSARIDKIMDRDCGTIVALKMNGIIPFVRSNVSQTLSIFQANNYIFGRSINIWNRDRNTGGSSGGQSGLISSLCSPLGIGNDIGGSVRIPALFTGLCSIKCCQERYDISPQYSTYFSPLYNGKTTYLSVTGPLAKSIEDLSLLLKSILNEKYNPNLSPYKILKPFNQFEYLNHTKKTLKIGYFKSHNILQTTKSSQRAVLQTVQYLKFLGHQLIEIQIPRMEQIIKLYIGELGCQGDYKYMYQLLEGQSSIPSFKKPKIIATLPNWIRKCLFYVIKRKFPRLYIFLENIQKMTVEQYLKHKDLVYKTRKQFLEWWKSNNFDHLIAPDFGCQANLINLTGEVSPCALYTFIWNLLNLPSGAISITTVQEDEQTYESVHEDRLTTLLKQTCQNSKGLPVGVQIIGLPFHQQKILSVMKVIQAKFQMKKYLYKINNLN